MSELQERVRDRLDRLSDVGELSIGTQGASFASSDIEVNITATSRTALEDAANRVLGAVRELDVTAQATSNLAEQQPYIGVVVDRTKAAKVGLTEAGVAALVSEAMQPTATGTVVIDDTTLTMYLVS